MSSNVSFSAPRRVRAAPSRSEEHTSELQSQSNLVCRLLLEKKKQPRSESGAPAEFDDIDGYDVSLLSGPAVDNDESHNNLALCRQPSLGGPLSDKSVHLGSG